MVWGALLASGVVPEVYTLAPPGPHHNLRARARIRRARKRSLQLFQKFAVHM